MKNYKIGMGLIYAFMTRIPFVTADLIVNPETDVRASPETYVINIIGLALVGGFIVGSMFLIRWIIRKIKNKQ